jgi:DNA-binding FrmR family transcriptional regulator
MTLDEAIKQCEEAAEDRDRLCKRCDAASGYSRSHNEAIRTQEAKEHEKCSQDFRQLAGWLKELKAYKEQEPCADAISRKAAIDAIWDGINMDIYTREVKECLEALPSVTPKQKTGEWIPVSERLPKQGESVICQCRANIIKVLKLDADFDWYQDADHCYMNGFVIAWRPLPEPYKAESEGKE